MLLGKENVIAEFLGSYSTSVDFIDHYRGQGAGFDYNWEERWIRDEGYLKIYPQAISAFLNKVGVKPDEITKYIYPCIIPRAHGLIGKQLGLKPEQVGGNLFDACGECGTAHPLAMLANELHQANPGDKLLVAGYGQGVDLMLFQVTENIKNIPERMGIAGSLAHKKVETTYTKFLQ